jgi:hypothetical protein
MRTSRPFASLSLRSFFVVGLGAVVVACSASSAPPGVEDGEPAAGAGGSAAGAASGGASASGGQTDAGAGGDTGVGGDAAGAAGSAPAGAGTGGAGSADSGGKGGSGTAGTGGGAAGDGSGGSIDVGGTGGTGIDIPDPQVSLVYAHSPTSLYQMDPVTKELSVVGDFTCLFNSSMWDIAIDSAGKMVGTASDRMVSIDPLTAKCQTLANGSFPNSLTFIPKGTLDPDVEALVGFRESEYVRIDPANGKISVIGDLNPNSTGQSWQSSGDVVSIIGDKTYLTAHPVAAGWSGTDTIVEVDPLTGKATKVIGDVGYGKLWGLAYWDSIAYGFSDGGQLVQIDLTSGAGKSVPLPTSLKNLSFYGAGVTTAARITPPK